MYCLLGPERFGSLSSLPPSLAAHHDDAAVDACPNTISSRDVPHNVIYATLQPLLQ